MKDTRKICIGTDEKGEINTIMVLNDEEEFNLNKNGLIQVNDIPSPDIHYCVNNVVKDRPIQKTKLNGLNLTDLPVPCTISINGTPYECDSETAELEFDQPTTYEIKVESWPYQEWSIIYENKT